MFNGIFQHVENYLELYLLFSVAIVIIIFGFLGFILFSYITASDSTGNKTTREISNRCKHKHKENKAA